MLNFFPPMKDWHRFALTDWYNIIIEDDGLKINFDLDKLQWMPLLDRLTMKTCNLNTTIYLMSSCEAYKTGMKTIRPNVEQCLAFENITPEITLHDYSQPYPAIIVEFPEEYRSTLMARFNTRIPRASVMYWNRDLPVLTLFSFYNHNYPVVVFYITPNAEYQTLDYAIDIITRMKTEDIDYFVNEPILRMCLNLALYATNFGTRNIGYENVKQHRHYERKEPLRARQDLYYFGLQQEIKLFSKKYIKNGEGNGLRQSPHPHWRMGYWRRQHYGPANSLIKRAFIPPVFVCSENYRGPMWDTGATYKG